MVEKILPEKTLVLIKPDGVKKSISGQIISRLESTGLKIVAIKMLWADENLASQHYYLDEEWAQGLYKKTKDSYDNEGRKMKHKDPISLGKHIQTGLIDFIKEGPVIAIVLEGTHAIEIVRKLVGSTEPRSASPGTIRSDFASTESYPKADLNSRAVRNLIHASDSLENAKREISLWFSPDEIHNYKNVHDFSEEHLK
jgi:nucleoside-diphosphate kinase